MGQLLSGLITIMCMALIALALTCFPIIMAKDRRRIQAALMDIGLTNSKGQTPILWLNKRDKKAHAFTMTFLDRGVTVREFREKRDAMSQALDITILGHAMYGGKGFVTIEARQGYTP